MPERPPSRSLRCLRSLRGRPEMLTVVRCIWPPGPLKPKHPNVPKIETTSETHVSGEGRSERALRDKVLPPTKLGYLPVLTRSRRQPPQAGAPRRSDAGASILRRSALETRGMPVQGKERPKGAQNPGTAFPKAAGPKVQLNWLSQGDSDPHRKIGPRGWAADDKVQ